jgi:hypothetical protein
MSMSCIVAHVGIDPLLADVDDETQRAQLLDLGPAMLVASQRDARPLG